jgi:trigger factor
MQVTETLSDGLRRGFTIILPAADIETRRAERLNSLSKTLRLPGFRPGKVPMPIIRQRYGTAVSAEVLEETVSEATRQVLNDRGLRPAMQPKVEITTEDPTRATGRDIEFKLDLELLPEIPLPEFAALALTRMKVEVTDDSLAEGLANLVRMRRTPRDLTPEERTERGDPPAARPGDVLTVDYVGKIGDTAFEGGTATDAQVDIGGEGFIPGFAEQIEGMRPGEQRTINVTFPAEYGNAELAGKAATFEITAKQLQMPVVPEMDDAFAMSFGYDSLDELRADLRSRRQRDIDGLARTRLKRQLLDALADRVSFGVPPSLLEREFEQIWQRLETDRTAGRLDEDDKGKDDETLKAEYRGIAERRVRLGLLLAEIGRLNSITVTESELARAIRQEAARYPGQEQVMMDLFNKYPALADNLRAPIFEDKIVDYVLELAQVTDTPVSMEELLKDPPPPATAVPAVSAPAPAEPPPA